MQSGTILNKAECLLDVVDIPAIILINFIANYFVFNAMQYPLVLRNQLLLILLSMPPKIKINKRKMSLFFVLSNYSSCLFSLFHIWDYWCFHLKVSTFIWQNIFIFSIFFRSFHTKVSHITSEEWLGR